MSNGGGTNAPDPRWCPTLSAIATLHFTPKSLKYLPRFFSGFG